MSDLQSITTLFKAMSTEDKEALTQLRAEMKTKTGQDVSLADGIKAVTPGMETPAYLKNC